MHTYIHTYIHTDIHTYVQKNVYIQTYIYAYKPTYVYPYLIMCIVIYIYLPTNLNTFLYMLTCTLYKQFIYERINYLHIYIQCTINLLPTSLLSILDDCLGDMEKDSIRWSKTPMYKCSCSVERVWRTLKLLPIEETRSIIEEGENIDVCILILLCKK